MTLPAWRVSTCAGSSSHSQVVMPDRSASAGSAGRAGAEGADPRPGRVGASPRGIRCPRPPPSRPPANVFATALAAAVGQPRLQFAEVLRRADRAPALVDGPERHAQVRRDALEVEVGRVDRSEREPPDRLPRAIAANGSRSAPRSGPSGSSAEIFAAQSAAGTTLPADRLRQRAQQRGDELVAHARAPASRSRRARSRASSASGTMHGHAVVVGARLEPVARASSIWSPCRQRSGNPSPSTASRVVAEQVGRASS